MDKNAAIRSEIKEFVLDLDGSSELNVAGTILSWSEQRRGVRPTRVSPRSLDARTHMGELLRRAANESDVEERSKAIGRREK